MGINAAAVDAEIARIDAALTAQVNEILHHPAFQRMEAAWRSLELLVEQVDFGQNIRVELLPCSKEELRRDFARAPGVEHTALHRIVYDAVYVTARGEPYGLLVGDYEFAYGDDDLALLEGIAAVAAKAHAPFITGVVPAMFGLASWGESVLGSGARQRSSRGTSKGRSTPAGERFAGVKTRAISGCACRASC